MVNVIATWLAVPSSEKVNGEPLGVQVLKAAFTPRPEQIPCVDPATGIERRSKLMIAPPTGAPPVTVSNAVKVGGGKALMSLIVPVLGKLKRVEDPETFILWVAPAHVLPPPQLMQKLFVVTPTRDPDKLPS